MGVLILIILIIGLCSWFISRAAYKVQVKNNYKSPMLTASLIFLLSFAVLAGGIFFIFVNMLNFSRH